jgi:hypothetical protein
MVNIMIRSLQSEFYEFINQRLANTATGDQHSARLGVLKMAALFASNGNQVLHESIVVGCLKDGLLECDTDMFLPLLEEVIAEANGQ